MGNHKLAILNEREKTHGSFEANASLSQILKYIFRQSKGWSSLHDEGRESLDMIALKLSRILSGQSGYYDHWKDIAGYASLAEEACQKPKVEAW